MMSRDATEWLTDDVVLQTHDELLETLDSGEVFEFIV